MLEIEYLGKPEIDKLMLTDNEILNAVEQGLLAAGKGETVIEPRMHLKPNNNVDGHFNILRGYIEPLGCAGVKIVSDYVNNYKENLPSEMGILNLFCPDTGSPKALIDASDLTDMRTGALTA